MARSTSEAETPDRPKRTFEGPTELLWSRGYDRLRHLARQYLSHEAPDHTLAPTALVHEVFLRIGKKDASDFRNRPRFFAYAARAMRNILVDHARRRRTVKRGRDCRRISFDRVLEEPLEFDEGLIALHDALTELEALDPQLAHIVDLLFFGGLTIDETAEVMGVAPITIDRAWKTAKSWLHVQLKKDS